jgi:hypothetical protein
MHPSAKGLRPWGPIDSSKRPTGAPLRGLRPGMRPHGLRDQPGGVERSTNKAGDLALFATVIDGMTGALGFVPAKDSQDVGIRLAIRRLRYSVKKSNTPSASAASPLRVWFSWTKPVRTSR